MCVCGGGVYVCVYKRRCAHVCVCVCVCVCVDACVQGGVYMDLCASVLC